MKTKISLRRLAVWSGIILFILGFWSGAFVLIFGMPELPNFSALGPHEKETVVAITATILLIVLALALGRGNNETKNLRVLLGNDAPTTS